MKKVTKNAARFTTIKDFTFAIVILVVALVWAGFTFASASSTDSNPAPVIEQTEKSQNNLSGLVPEKDFIVTQKSSVGMLP